MMCYSRWLLCCQSVVPHSDVGWEDAQSAQSSSQRPRILHWAKAQEVKTTHKYFDWHPYPATQYLQCENSLNITWGDTKLTDFWNPCLQACKLLSDDYEQVRSAAVQLIWVVSQLYPERSVWV